MTEEAIKRNAEEFIEENCIYDKNSIECDYIRAAYIAGYHSRDEEVDELEERHEEDKLCRESTAADNKFYKEFIYYLSEKAVGKIDSILEAVANNMYNDFIGYVKVTKEINSRQKLVLVFDREDGTYRATWDACDNYASYQRCGVEADDYSGYLLFPTYKEDEYFCMYYQC